MKRKQLWKISIDTAPEAEEAVTDLLQSTFGQPASSYINLDKRVASVMLFLERPPAQFHKLRRHLQRKLNHVRACGLNIGPAAVSLQKLRNEDWANSWKRHFKPIQIGSALLIKPPWSKRRARCGQAVLVLNPGLSFGTGQHPTTEFCLREIVARRNRALWQSFLDIGTGSGILAIAAAKLGYLPVDGLDFDRNAIRIARANARTNRVFKKIRFQQADLAKLSAAGRKKYDLICANLISTLLTEHRKQIISRLAPGGVVVAAGILCSEFWRVRRAFESAGLKLIAEKSGKEWNSGTFRYLEKSFE